MFQYAKERQVLWPVNVAVPTADGSGKVEEHPCKLLFLLMSDADMQAMAMMPEDAAQATLASHIKGWEDIGDEDGNDLVFNSTNLNALLEDIFFAKAATIALWQASKGAPAKNS